MTKLEAIAARALAAAEAYVKALDETGGTDADVAYTRCLYDLARAAYAAVAHLDRGDE